jgi:hypothetical protein
MTTAVMAMVSRVKDSIRVRLELRFTFRRQSEEHGASFAFRAVAGTFVRRDYSLKHPLQGINSGQAKLTG